ncbi:cilia- and flagella-associated protein 52-like [Schistocerca americana]|uniref:cilia- and flagella-associated protein 52-like n=1 Tax=Schistocerca americana TaxID=7009 RepID=UPI001F4F8F4F|nr:cilia- and flagella-associated protein 52-like [Schistocerca americana]
MGIRCPKKDQLQYELQIRGRPDDGGVSELSARLRDAVALPVQVSKERVGKVQITQFINRLSDLAQVAVGPGFKDKANELRERVLKLQVQLSALEWESAAVEDGQGGVVPGGLQVHPDGEHIVYPLGCKVVIQNWKTKVQTFLTGHTNVICAVSISKEGKYVASAQVNHMGHKATVMLWEFDTLKLVTKHEIHKVRVESVIFSCDSHYLVSLGGRDDGNVVVWDIKESEALCGCPASHGVAGDAVLLCPTSRHPLNFISGGDVTLKLWKMEPEKRHVSYVDIKIGTLKRHVICSVVDAEDEYAYCGTTSGDILKIRLNYGSGSAAGVNPVLEGCYAKIPKKKLAEGAEPSERYSKGVTALTLLTEKCTTKVVVAAGDGTVELVKERSSPVSLKKSALRLPTTPKLVALKSAKLDSGATSVKIMRDEIIAGTDQCEIYTINIATFNVSLHITCHTDAIYDLTFPYKCSEYYATSSKNDIRVWDAKALKELLRITVLNLTCASIVFTCDGKSIISGWNDGVIRGFTRRTGKLQFDIPYAHNLGVTALAITVCGSRLISGDGEGLIRIWEMKPNYQKSLASLTGHSDAVSSICISNSGTEAVSACTDGTCIIWDIVHLHHKQFFSANAPFLCARYIPSDVQIITAGADHKIRYLEVFDGSYIRELEGSSAAGMTSVDVSPDGNYIVTGSCDMYVKVWRYKEGNTTHIGTGHAAVITAVRFSPDGTYIVSVSADGAIFQWKCPYDCSAKEIKPESVQSASRLSKKSHVSAGADQENENQQKVEQTEENTRKQETLSADANKLIRNMTAGEDTKSDDYCACLETLGYKAAPKKAGSLKNLRTDSQERCACKKPVVQRCRW